MKYKTKNKWIHYSFGGSVPLLKRNADGKTTPCGKTANRIAVTTNRNDVTCQRCLDVLNDEKND